MDAPQVAVNGSAPTHGKEEKPNMPRVPSRQRLGDHGGTRLQLLGRCLTKALALGVIVYLLTSPSIQLPRLAQELLYCASHLSFLCLP